MATEPDEIGVDAATPANDDRSVEIVGGHRSDFKAVPSTAQAVKKSYGQCRMVVEIPFDFPRDFLKSEEDRLGMKFFDGVDYLRVLQKQWETGEIHDLQHFVDTSVEYGDNGVRVTAAK